MDIYYNLFASYGGFRTDRRLSAHLWRLPAQLRRLSANSTQSVLALCPHGAWAGSCSPGCPRRWRIPPIHLHHTAALRIHSGAPHNCGGFPHPAGAFPRPISGFPDPSAGGVTLHLQRGATQRLSAHGGRERASSEAFSVFRSIGGMGVCFLRSLGQVPQFSLGTCHVVCGF